MSNCTCHKSSKWPYMAVGIVVTVAVVSVAVAVVKPEIIKTLESQLKSD